MFEFLAKRRTAPSFAAKATEADLHACYRLLLGRAAKPEELSIHAGRIGGELRALVSAFTTSVEFARRGLTPLPSVAGETATEADIAACFRLLLGRKPNREEWVGHVGQVGERLKTVVAGYAGSLEFAQRRLTHRSGRVALIEQAGFRIYADLDDAAVGLHVAGGSYEPDVTAALRRCLRPGMAAIDIGANIGFLAMLAASIVGPGGSVLAIEPNPRNARMLEASRRANGFGQVTVVQAAAGRASGLLVLNATHSNGTTSAMPQDAALLLEAETVACLRVDALVTAQMRVDLIKVDVEGAEYNALLGCGDILARCRPIILTEFSPDLIGSISDISGPDYLGWLVALGYRLAVIEPDGATSEVDPEQAMAVYLARGTDHIDLVATPI